MTERFRRALERAGWGAIRFHDQRQSFATALAALCIVMRTLMQLCGHSSSGTTLRHHNVACGRDMIERAFGTAS